MSIAVKKSGDGRYAVIVSDTGGETRHTVTVRAAYAEKLTGGKAAVETLVERSFEFLLAREPKEDILPEFDLSVIARYFPEYESEIRKKL